MFEDEARTIDRAMIRVNKMLAKHATGNTAPIPIAMWQEWGEDLGGEKRLLWYVQIHVRIPHVTEYEVETIANTLADALSDAAKSLRNQSNFQRNASRDAQIFGYSL
jgi:hypothetical protein